MLDVVGVEAATKGKAGALRAPKKASSLGYLVVDMQRALAESAHGKAARASLDAIVERTEPQRKSMYEQAMKAKGRERERALKALGELDESRRQDLDTRASALREALIGLATTVIRTIAAEHGADLVIERRGALVFDSSLDVTDEVIQRMDAIRAAKSSGTGG